MDTITLWERTGADEMSASQYAVSITFWTAFGIAASAVTAYVAQTWDFSLGLCIATLVLAIAGIWISQSTDCPAVAVCGYLLLTLSFGALTGPVVAMYTPASVARIFCLTLFLVVSLGVVGALVPKSLESWFSWLFGGLLILVAGYILLPAAAYLGLPVDNSLNLLDWAGVVVFSGFVIYDLNRAMRIPYTMKNAIDCAVQVYLDFINILLRLLSAMGDSRDD